MPRARQRAQVVAETVLLLLCAALVVAFYGALIALIGAVWMTKNDVTVRIALTVFALAWFWPIVHALIWRRAWRKPWRAARASAGEGESDPARPRESVVDLTVLEHERQATPAPSPSQHLDAGHRGRAASV